MDFSTRNGAPGTGFLRKILGSLFGFGIFIVAAGGFFYHSSNFGLSNSTSSPAAPADPKDVTATTSSEPENLKPVFEGRIYTVGPGEWTVIDVRPPVTPGQYQYDVRFEGLTHFRARPDGDPRREFVYPGGQNLQPYQISGKAQTFWVQALDGGVHQVRMKYVRTAARDQSGRMY